VKKQPNIILIVLDTMRKDSVPVSGSLGEKSNLERFRDDAVVYENAIAPAPWTIPSHISMFTGKYPAEHGIHETHEFKAEEVLKLKSAEKLETLQEDLRKSGYNTVGVSANPILLNDNLGGFNYFLTFEEENSMWPDSISSEERDEWRKYTAGIPDVKSAVATLAKRGQFREIYRLYSIRKRLIRRNNSNNYPLIKNGDRVVRSVTEGKLEEPFFIFLNFLEMHEPYTRYELKRGRNLGRLGGIPGPVLNEMRLKYQLAGVQLDTFLGQLIKHWKGAGVYDESLIVVTSDHGQEFMEQGYIGHCTFLHDEILKIPLMVKHPDNKRIPQSAGYQSLTSLPNLIKRAVEGEVYKDELTSECAFSEAFGTNEHETEDPATKERMERDRGKLDKSRKAIYWNGYKLAVNWDERVIEEFSHNGKKLDLQERKEVLGELQQKLEEFAKKEVISSPVEGNFSKEEEAEIEARLRSLGYA
jgi:arylsulfatase A-like enzyme